MILTCINNCIGGPTLINLDYITNINFEADFNVCKDPCGKIRSISFWFHIKICLTNGSVKYKCLSFPCEKDKDFCKTLFQRMQDFLLEFKGEVLDKVSLWGDNIYPEFNNFIQKQIDRFNQILEEDNN